MSETPLAPQGGRVIAYEIRDAAGTLAAIHERYDEPDGSKRFTWRRPDGTVGLNGTPIADLPLYGIHKLGAETIVVVCEGEKSADALVAIGIPAVATVTGASSTPGRIALAELTGRAVVVWADADNVGLDHMRRTVAGIEKVGAASVGWITWPDAPPHGDAADYLAAGGTRDDVVALIRAARVLPIMKSRAERLGDAATPDAAPAPDAADTWPDPPAAAAYHGVLGDLAQAVAPHTEADPVAILGSMLAMFGSACGRGRSFYQGSMQRTNLSVVLVGATGFGGRKGTALDVCRSIFGLAYPDLDKLWLVGVASGEAITGHLGRVIDGRPRYETEERTLIVEPEFGRLLTIMNREGSTLSAVLRNAWDGTPLGHARARDESLIVNHHVAMLGHVTPVELRQKLTDTDAANGFANRLLFVAVRRSRLIPFPKAPDDLVREYVGSLHRAIIEAQTVGEMAFDQPARDRWETFYAELALTPRLGLSGAVTGRHEAQVARLSLVYALADRSAVIGADHLEAAIAFADYARRSAIWALGDSTGNRHADVLRRMLVDGEITYDEAKRGLGLRTAADLDDAVATLVDAGLVSVVKVARLGGGRPTRVIRANGANGANGARGTRTKQEGIVT